MALGGEVLVEGGWKFEIQPSSRGADVGIRLGVRGTGNDCVAIDLALKREIGALGGDDGWEAPLRGGSLVLSGGYESEFSHLCDGQGLAMTVLLISVADDSGRGMMVARASVLTPLAIGLVWAWFGSAMVSLEWALVDVVRLGLLI
ncbi:hypothetical protein ACLB2K_034249 [Fragaria x ananassa]